MADAAKTVRYRNAEGGSVVNVDEATAAQLGPEWSLDTEKAKPSAQGNTFGVAPKVDLDANPVGFGEAVEEPKAPAKKAASSKKSQ